MSRNQLDSAAFHAVVDEARRRDLIVTFSAEAASAPWKYIHIAGRPCQVSRTNAFHNSVEYPDTSALKIYLPRTGFADFVIYMPMDSESSDFYIIPRGKLTKDTSLTPESLEPYKNAWHLLSDVSLDLMMRRKNRLSWQLQSIMLAAESRGLQFELIKTRKAIKRPNDFRVYLQRRIMIEGKRCSIYSASGVPRPNEKECRVVVVKGPRDTWADFQLYLTKDGVTYVVPRGQISKTTSLSLNSPVLVPYQNAWHLLSEAQGQAP
jgi:hypothetical protein